jgi:hypothetical protein
MGQKEMAKGNLCVTSMSMGRIQSGHLFCKLHALQFPAERFKFSGFLCCVIQGITVDGWKDCSAFICKLKQSSKEYTGVPPYLLIQYLWFQLSVVYCGLKKKIGKSKRNKQFVFFKMPAKREQAVTR